MGAGSEKRDVGGVGAVVRPLVPVMLVMSVVPVMMTMPVMPVMLALPVMTVLWC